MCEETENDYKEIEKLGRTTLDGLIEISALLYVLYMVLDNEHQPTNDTIPYSRLAKIIMTKNQALIEALTNAFVISE